MWKRQSKLEALIKSPVPFLRALQVVQAVDMKIMNVKKKKKALKIYI